MIVKGNNYIMTQSINEKDYFAPQISKSNRKIMIQYQRMFRFVGLEHYLPNGPALDIGCGAGPGLRYLTKRGANVFGADASRYALHHAQQIIPNAAFVEINALTIFPFADVTFGLILANEIVEHLTNGIFFLRECYRILRPGGVIILTTPNLWDIRRVTHPLIGKVWSGDTDPTHINLYTPKRLHTELADCGFQYPRVRTGFKPMHWFPPHHNPIALPYPPWVGNGIVASGVR